jgi:hypothetical protein
MSITSLARRRLVGVILAGGLAFGGLATATPAAHAELVGTCETLPLTTPGATVLGVHVPSISNVELCAHAGYWDEVRNPRVEQRNGCGTPCLVVYSDAHPVQAGFNGASVVIRWRADGIEQQPIPAISIPPDGQEWHDFDEICVLTIGTPEPSC